MARLHGADVLALGYGAVLARAWLLDGTERTALASYGGGGARGRLRRKQELLGFLF